MWFFVRGCVIFLTQDLFIAHSWGGYFFICTKFKDLSDNVDLQEVFRPIGQYGWYRNFLGLPPTLGKKIELMADPEKVSPP